MNPNYLKNEGDALRVQRHQLNNSDNKLSEIDSLLSLIQKEQDQNSYLLDNMIDNMECFLQECNQASVSQSTLIENFQSIENELYSSTMIQSSIVINELDQVDYKDNMTWDEYTNSLQEYGFRHNIDLTQDPFIHLMTKSQQVELQKRIKEDFSLKNANCDKYDYLIAGTCGVISGLVDILFVGAPNESTLGNIVDEKANQITEKFAEYFGWNKEEVLKKGSNTTASAIGFLERKFKVNYDQATTNGDNGTGGIIKNLSMSNHHLKSLGHSPDIIGLFFSILNQFTSTSSFINNGKIITIETDEFELQGHNLIAKIFCGFANWFGHIMSDWAGSSGTVGQGGRGTGVPVPFYNLFQMINFGAFGKDRQNFATVTTKVFEQGYDFRHGMAMAIPVVINELLIRFMYTMKAHFYHEKNWLDSVPKGNIPEVQRMLLVGHGTLCLLDGADAYIRSGGEMVQFLLRTNLIAWTRFGHLALKEVYTWYNIGHIDADAVDKYIDDDLKKMLRTN